MTTTPHEHQHDRRLNPEDEDGQTMAEYSVALTLIIIVFGIGAFFVLAAAISGQYDRVTGFFT